MQRNIISIAGYGSTIYRGGNRKLIKQTNYIIDIDFLLLLNCGFFDPAMHFLDNILRFWLPLFVAKSEFCQLFVKENY